MLSRIIAGLASGGDSLLWAPHDQVSPRRLLDEPWFARLRREAAGRSVVVRTRDQLAAAMALIALDGSARSLVLCPPDVSENHMASVIVDAEADAILGDGDAAHPLILRRRGAGGPRPVINGATRWLLFTSGTSGPPKMVAHTLDGLTGAIRPSAPGGAPIVWATFYDIRRYGGLQILLRALLGGASLVLSQAGEPVADFLARAGAHGAGRVTGTPSHWRNALMSPAIGQIAPTYARLSGEIADQAVLDALAAAFPRAAIGHAYASTEAGVGFEVTDGLEGFPASLIGPARGEVEMRVVDDTLRLKSERCALGYVGRGAPQLRDGEGFVDSGDVLERRGERYYFVGRRGGIINVGGLKIHPEEVETVINRHPAVSMSLVRGRRNPITGAIVVAELVLADPPAPQDRDAVGRAVREQVLDLCRAALPPFKVPASIKVVDALAVTAGGKLERSIA